MGIILPLALFLIPIEECRSLDVAAHQALVEALSLSTKFEHGGALYELNGCYHYTKPETSQSRYKLELRIRIPHGSKLAGIYHTHPSTGDGGYKFSSDDIEMQKAIGLPSYLGVNGMSGSLVIDSDHQAPDSEPVKCSRIAVCSF